MRRIRHEFWLRQAGSQGDVTPFRRVIGEFCDKHVVTRGTKKNTAKEQVLEIDGKRMGSDKRKEKTAGG